MKTFAKSALAAVSACALFVSVGAFAGHHDHKKMHKGYSCMTHGKHGVHHCVKTYKKGGHVVTVTKTKVPVKK